MLPWYVQCLDQEFSRRQRTNPRYSMRSFAKFLGINSAALSEILRGKRNLSAKHLPAIVSKLELSPTKTQAFERSFLEAKSSTPLATATLKKIEQQQILMEDLYYDVIAEWEYFAVLSLFKVKDFKESAPWIAKRLGIETTRAKKVVLNLKKLGLLKRNKGGFLERSQSEFASTQDIPSKALRESHVQSMDCAKQALENLEPAKRYFVSETLAGDPKNLESAKNLFREFKPKLSDIMEEGDATEVYQIAFQIYPLTDVPTSEK